MYNSKKQASKRQLAHLKTSHGARNAANTLKPMINLDLTHLNNSMHNTSFAQGRHRSVIAPMTQQRQRYHNGLLLQPLRKNQQQQSTDGQQQEDQGSQDGGQGVPVISHDDGFPDAQGCQPLSQQIASKNDQKASEKRGRSSNA